MEKDKRTHVEILLDYLIVIRNNDSKLGMVSTDVLYKTNVSYQMNKRLQEYCLVNGLIEEREKTMGIHNIKCYKNRLYITEKGIQTLETIKKATDDLNSFKW